VCAVCKRVEKQVERKLCKVCNLQFEKCSEKIKFEMQLWMPDNKQEVNCLVLLLAMLWFVVAATCLVCSGNFFSPLSLSNMSEA